MWVEIGVLTSLLFFSSVSLVHGFEPPVLVFEAPDTLQPLVARLEKIPPSQFRESMDVVGLARAGDPIRVIIAPERSEWAQHIPTWVSGYAIPRLGVIVILPERVVGYPYDSLENVLSHELAHIFASRASRGQTIPRWLDEGLAMVAAHSWGFEDSARLTWAIVSGVPIPLEHLDTLFHQDRASATQAYVLSHAIVRYFIQEYGRGWPRDVLAALGHGLPFEEAFARATFTPLEQAEAAFWAHQTVWTRWVPAVTSTIALWIGILALAVYAFKKQRQRAEALKRRWKEEEDLNR